jgi:hypothetical protein
MTPFEVEVDVPESRQVTVTLPPEVPAGRVRLALSPCGESETTDATYVRPVDPAEAAAFDSFMKLLPGLRPTHGGLFVAVQGGRVLASGLFLDGVLKLAHAAAGNAAFYCAWVEPVGGYVFRSGLIGVLPDSQTV